MAEITSRPEDWEQFRTQQRKIETIAKTAKTEYESRLGRNIKHTVTDFYSYIKRKRLARPIAGPFQLEAG